MLPGTLLYVYLGHIGQATLISGGQRSALENGFLGAGLIATIGVSIYLSRLAKKTLEQKKANRSSDSNSRRKTRESNSAS